ncbi:glycoside hydrolase family 3 protein [Thermodesulfobacterium sp. TA1]|uniref:glycoside hydrolase family 3 protein n=1 Tax=Thermodesulfobacterium sp. TA1 TaxID=2234087 RepID=UPI00143DC5C7|nr:glycoside hydrolase family 3 protein [Thermodesulfobacterium sp. TA1]
MVKPQDLSTEERELYRDLKFVNFIFFKEHFQGDFQEILTRLKSLGELGFLAVDQEGGRVCRIPGDFASPLEISLAYQKSGDISLVKNWAKSLAKAVIEKGLNLNLAPVVDLVGAEAEEFIRSRTFGKDPELVKLLGEVVISEHKKLRCFTCVKHFPGLDEVNIDPHKALPQKEKVSQPSLEVFRFFAEKEAPFLMTTHLVVKTLEDFPVTFSSKAVKMLREQLGFKGGIVTDDLNMGALGSWELAERIILSLASGHNLLIFCGSLNELASCLFDIKTEIEKSPTLKARLSESLYLLNRLKERFYG